MDIRNLSSLLNAAQLEVMTNLLPFNSHCHSCISAEEEEGKKSVLISETLVVSVVNLISTFP